MIPLSLHVVVSNTVGCNDGSVFDNNKESCDAVEPEVASATNDTLTPKEKQLIKERDLANIIVLITRSFERSKKDRADTHKNEVSAYSKGYYVSHHDERTKQFSDYYASHNQKIKDSAR